MNGRLIRYQSGHNKVLRQHGGLAKGRDGCHWGGQCSSLLVIFSKWQKKWSRKTLCQNLIDGDENHDVDINFELTKIVAVILHLRSFFNLTNVTFTSEGRGTLDGAGDAWWLPSHISMLCSFIFLTGICRGTQLTNPSHKIQLSRAINYTLPLIWAMSKSRMINFFESVPG